MPDNVRVLLAEDNEVNQTLVVRVLQNHGVKIIDSPKNGEFDPAIHQAVMQVDAADVEPGHIVATLQPGFMLNDRVIRPATVTVRPTAKVVRQPGAAPSR